MLFHILTDKKIISRVEWCLKLPVCPTFGYEAGSLPYLKISGSMKIQKEIEIYFFKMTSIYSNLRGNDRLNGKMLKPSLLKQK